MWSSLYLMALSWYFVSSLGNNSGLAIMFAISSIPSLVFGPFIGPLIEKWNKKWLIVASNVICSIIVGTLALLVHSELADAVLIYLLCFLMNIVQIFVSPSVNSLIPSIVPEERLQEAMSYIRMINFLGQILGAAIGGMLVGFIGVVPTICFNSAALLIAACATSLIRNMESIKNNASKYLTMMKEGWTYFLSNKMILSSALLCVACNLFIPVLTVFVPIIIKTDLGLDALHFGFADAMIPAGAVIVSLILARVKVNLNPLQVLAIGIAGAAACYGILGYTSNYFIILPTLLLYGCALNFINVTIITYLVKIVAADYRGRFFSILESFSYASISIAYVLSSLMAEFLTSSASMKICSIGLFVICALALIISRQKIKAN